MLTPTDSAAIAALLDRVHETHVLAVAFVLVGVLAHALLNDGVLDRVGCLGFHINQDYSTTQQQFSSVPQ